MTPAARRDRMTEIRRDEMTTEEYKRSADCLDQIHQVLSEHQCRLALRYDCDGEPFFVVETQKDGEFPMGSRKESRDEC